MNVRNAGGGEKSQHSLMNATVQAAAAAAQCSAFLNEFKSPISYEKTQLICSKLYTEIHINSLRILFGV